MSSASFHRSFLGWTYHRYSRTTSMLGRLVGFSIFLKRAHVKMSIFFSFGDLALLPSFLFLSLPHLLFSNVIMLVHDLLEGRDSVLFVSVSYTCSNRAGSWWTLNNAYHMNEAYPPCLWDYPRCCSSFS